VQRSNPLRLLDTRDCHAATLGHRGRRSSVHVATSVVGQQNAPPLRHSPEVNVRREMGKFKPVIFGQIHAAGDSYHDHPRKPLLNHLVGGGQQRFRNFDASSLAVCRLMTNSNFVARITGRSGVVPEGVRLRPPA
jgi:hypothetical protein